jgi:hypothetical protein
MAGVLRRPSAIFPLVLSLLAIALIAVHIAIAGTAPHSDEGTAAHVWQLLMTIEVPAIVYFAITAVPESPKPALAVLAIQVLAALAAVAPVFVFRW